MDWKFDPVAFGNAVKAKRLHAGLSLRQLFDVTGVAPSSLHRVEAGKSCNVTTYVSLADWLYKSPPPKLCSACSGTGFERAK